MRKKKKVNIVLANRFKELLIEFNGDSEKKFLSKFKKEYEKVIGCPIETSSLSQKSLGKESITYDNAILFSKILRINPDYLLDENCKSKYYDTEWLKYSASLDHQKISFFEHCLRFWNYKIIEIIPYYEANSNDNSQSLQDIYRIENPNGEIIEKTDDELINISEEILRSVRRYLIELL